MADALARDRPARTARPHAYVVADRSATLAWLGNQAALEIHPWTSRIEAPGRADVGPDRHRPGPADDVGRDAALARLFRRALEHLGVAGIPR